MTKSGGKIVRTICVLALLAPLVVMADTSSAGAQTDDSIVTVDSVGDVGKQPSLTLDAAGNPVVSYYDATNTDLKVLRCGDMNCGSGNVLTRIERDDDRGEFSSLTLPASDEPVISYYDRTEGALGLIYCQNPSCSSHVDGVVTAATADEGRATSMALNSSGLPVVAFYDFTNGDLRVLICTFVFCNTRVWATPDTLGDVGSGVSLALDAADNPVISYYDATNFDLKVLRCTNTTCSSTSSTNPDLVGTVGLATSLVLDASGNAVVSYWDATNGDLKILRCGNANCNSGNVTTNPDSADLVGLGSSLVLDAAGNPVVSYWDVTNLDLKLLHCGNHNCTSGNSITSPDTGGSVGSDTSLVLDAGGNPVVAYYDSTNGDLKILHCDDPNCVPPLCSGVPPTIDMNANGGDGTGTAGDDVIVGTAGHDLIRGLGGSDIVCGRGGNDVIKGGADNDTLDGGAGDDTISAGGGSDIVWGRGGADVLRGQGGVDLIMGGSGDDTVDGNGAADTLHGEAGNDTMNGQNGGDFLIGGSGDDDLGGQTGPDQFEGGPDDDTMLGGNGADTLYGDAGFDKCSGNTGPDSAEAASCEQTPGVETLF